MPQISVVIPVFNTAKHLRKCILSIWSQGFDIQIIAINDASSDNSVEVLNRLRSEGISIDIIDLKKNVGVEVARYLGVKRATGKYLMFVDSDDYLPKFAVQTLLNAITKYKADVVQGSFKRVLDNYGLLSKISQYPASQFPVVISQPELNDKYYISFFGGRGVSVSLWGKLYRRNLFSDDVLVKTGFRFGEDAVLNMRIFPKLSTYVIIPDVVYCYRFGGMTSKYKAWLWDELKTQYRYRLSFLDTESNVKEIVQMRSEMVNNFIGVISSMYRHKVDETKVIALYYSELMGGAARFRHTRLTSVRPVV